MHFDILVPEHEKDAKVISELLTWFL
jgi:hypothetical protein